VVGLFQRKLTAIQAAVELAGLAGMTAGIETSGTQPLGFHLIQ
jgi:hypothetical protein